MGWPLLAGVIAAWFYPLAAMVPGGGWRSCYVFAIRRQRIAPGGGILVSPATDGTVAGSRAGNDRIHRRPRCDRISCPSSACTSTARPSASRVIELRYQPGNFCAMNPESAIRNENLWIALEEESPPHHFAWSCDRSGLIARRIVCNLRGERSSGP
jgi:hypothetical protein